ncbi:MAG: A/G-specific adenine glycosylase [Chlamydiales bacterium]
MVALFPHEELIRWFKRYQRDLPWRGIFTSPYAVWISEVMLQQTQVKVVIPYFERWMKEFPTLKSLAMADEKQVIKLWEGLGYYSRARNLHRGARYVLDNFGEELPDNEQQLKQIKGIGPYTVGAILSFAFKQKAAAVDGNVLRVLARYYNIHEDISSTLTINRLRKIAYDILPEKETWVFNEALIELGALVCKKKPECSQCPLQHSCEARKTGSEALLPVKRKAKKTEKLFRAVAIIENPQQILLKKGEKGKVMEGLYEFPYLECTRPQPSKETLYTYLKQLGIDSFQYYMPLKPVFHTFTSFHATLYPHRFKLDKKEDILGHEWVDKKILLDYPFSSGHKRILIQLREFFDGKSPTH